MIQNDYKSFKMMLKIFTFVNKVETQRFRTSF